MSNTQLTLGSLFSGSGGFELAGVLAGMKPVWFVPDECFVSDTDITIVRNFREIYTLFMEGGEV